MKHHENTMKRHENTMKRHENTMKHLKNTYQTPKKHLKNTYQTPKKHLKNTENGSFDCGPFGSSLLAQAAEEQMKSEEDKKRQVRRSPGQPFALGKTWPVKRRQRFCEERGVGDNPKEFMI